MKIVGRTDRGRVRPTNQDAVAVDAAHGLAVLADGMGGLQQGEVASLEAVRVLREHMIDLARRGPAASAPDLGQLLQQANTHVWQLGRAQRPPVLMGTTAVAVLLAPSGRGLLAHVGDSRAYCWRGGRLLQLTRDHSLVQERVERGLLTPEQARHSPQRNVITRALGLDADLQVDCQAFELAAGELLLLCSDGLWGMLADRQIEQRLAPAASGAADLERVAEELIDAANAAGGQDNISVVLARPHLSSAAHATTMRA